MKQAGLRDVEAFTLYQKGLEMFERAHGEMDTIEGLRQANVYFDQVIERVPTGRLAYDGRRIHPISTNQLVGNLTFCCFAQEAKVNQEQLLPALLKISTQMCFWIRAIRLFFPRA